MSLAFIWVSFEPLSAHTGIAKTGKHEFQAQKNSTEQGTELICNDVVRFGTPLAAWITMNVCPLPIQCIRISVVF